MYSKCGDEKYCRWTKRAHKWAGQVHNCGPQTRSRVVCLKIEQFCQRRPTNKTTVQTGLPKFDGQPITRT